MQDRTQTDEEPQIEHIAGKDHVTIEALPDGREAVVKRGGPVILQEALVLSTAQSEYLPELLGVEKEGSGKWAVYFERIKGHSLAETIGLEPSAGWSSNRQSVEDTATILDNIAKPFVALHEAGILYRDLNLDHIIFTDDGKAKLIDFDLAVFRNPQGRYINTTPKGTWETMAPEEFLGKHPDEDLSEATNVYSLAVVATQLLSGENPFYVSPDWVDEEADGSLKDVAYKWHSDQVYPHALERMRIPANLHPVLIKAMSPAQGDRYQTVNEFVAAFKAAAVQE